MPAKKTDEARLLQEALETARALHSHGLLSKADLSSISALCEPPPDYTPRRVVSIRTRKARMSQAVFASFLNVSVSTVQKWESPSANKHPSGAAAKLLQLVETKGVEALIVP